MISSMPRSRSRFELDGEVAGVGFGDGGEAELQAGAPRSALHFGRALQDLLDAEQHWLVSARDEPAGMR